MANYTPPTRYYTPQFTAMLAIQIVVHAWNNRELSDQQALREIEKISTAEQKRTWDAAHS